MKNSISFPYVTLNKYYDVTIENLTFNRKSFTNMFILIWNYPCMLFLILNLINYPFLPYMAVHSIGGEMHSSTHTQCTVSYSLVVCAMTDITNTNLIYFRHSVSFITSWYFTFNSILVLLLAQFLNQIPISQCYFARNIYVLRTHTFYYTYTDTQSHP